MKRRTCLASAGVLVAGLAGCSGERGQPRATNTSTPTAAEAIVFNGHEYRVSPDPGVHGQLENTAAQAVELVTISAKFYDKDDVRLEEWTVNVDDIAPGEVVAFTVPYPDYRTPHLVERYEIAIDPETTWYT